MPTIEGKLTLFLILYLVEDRLTQNHQRQLEGTVSSILFFRIYLEIRIFGARKYFRDFLFFLWSKKTGQ